MISRYRLRRRRAELDAAVARKMKLRRRRRLSGYIDPVPVLTETLVPPFVISGPFLVEDPILGMPVYTSSWYTEAPTVVNTMDAWNVLRSTSVNFPLFWNRMY